MHAASADFIEAGRASALSIYRHGDMITRVTSTAAAPRNELGIAWGVGQPNGWGTYGLHLALGLSRWAGPRPRLLVPTNPQHLPPLVRVRLADEVRRSQESIGELPGVVAHRVFNRFTITTAAVWARRNIGLPFIEDTALDIPDIARSMAFDLVVAGSSWNAELLRSAGVGNVTLVTQGVDVSTFHPAPALRLFGDRFIVFSGGKLEYRKGQDIVIAAFRAFHERHPDSLLVCAWHHTDRRLFEGLDRAGHVTGVPEARDGAFDRAGWVAANGVPRDAVVDVGAVFPWVLASVVREATVALFPNRCEGGTNLLAMECMASGVPTILSGNTGHLDLIAGDNCYPLRHQGPVPSPVAGYRGTQGWGESDVAEIVEALERMYDDSAAARQRGRAAAESMRAFTWSNKIDELLGVIEPVVESRSGRSVRA